MKTRKVFLDDKVIHLRGPRPKMNTPISVRFNIPAARNAQQPLKQTDLMQGIFIISTLPNIQKSACMRQILDLEHVIQKNFKDSVTLVHISSDEARYWQEVDDLHPHLKAKAYTLDGVPEEIKEEIADMLGVGVVDSHRIAHGIFGFKDGRIIAAMIPRQQMGNPDVRVFVRRFKKAVEKRCEGYSGDGKS